MTSSSSGVPESTTSRTSRSTSRATPSIVFTGLSGSGKSSPRLRHHLRRGPAPLRRVAVGLRAPVPRPDGQARRRLHRGAVAGGLHRPEVDLDRNPRSTVGTITEVYDYLRLLFARAGRPHCPDLRRARSRGRRPQQIVDRVLELERGHPVPGARAGRPRPQGRVRRPLPPSCRRRASPGPGSTARPHPLDRAADARQAEEAHHRGRRRPARRSRPSRQAPAHRLGRDRARPGRRASWSSTSSTCDAKDPGRELRFSREDGLPQRPPASTPTSSSRARSPSTRPFGACPECHGLGTRMEVDPELVVPDADAQRSARARSRPWASAHVADYFQRAHGRARRRARLRPRHAVARRCRRSAQEALLARHEPTKVHVRHRNRYGRERVLLHRLRGRPSLRRAPAPRGRVRHQPGALRGLHARGARARPARAPGSSRCRWRSLVGGRNIAEVCRLPIDEAAEFLAHARAVTARERQIARAGAQGDPGAARLPPRRRPRLPLPRPSRRHALRRRGAADPARHPDRRRPGRRALRPRRAVASACTSATTTG